MWEVSPVVVVNGVIIRGVVRQQLLVERSTLEVRQAEAGTDHGVSVGPKRTGNVEQLGIQIGAKG